jgi:hypothetical protein
MTNFTAKRGSYMTSYLYKTPGGFLGAITRPDESQIEDGTLSSNVAELPTAYGVPVKLNGSGAFAVIEPGDLASAIYGVLVRNAPAIAGTINSEGYNVATPNSESTQGILVRGYVNVKCTHGTPVRGEPVFVCNVSGLVGRTVGDFEATSDASNVQVEAKWAVDGVDENNVSELRWLY